MISSIPHEAQTIAVSQPTQHDPPALLKTGAILGSSFALSALGEIAGKTFSKKMLLGGIGGGIPLLISEWEKKNKGMQNDFFLSLLETGLGIGVAMAVPSFFPGMLLSMGLSATIGLFQQRNDEASGQSMVQSAASSSLSTLICSGALLALGLPILGLAMRNRQDPFAEIDALIKKMPKGGWPFGRWARHYSPASNMYYTQFYLTPEVRKLITKFLGQERFDSKEFSMEDLRTILNIEDTRPSTDYASMQVLAKIFKNISGRPVRAVMLNSTGKNKNDCLTGDNLFFTLLRSPQGPTIPQVDLFSVSQDRNRNGLLLLKHWFQTLEKLAGDFPVILAGKVSGEGHYYWPLLGFTPVTRTSARTNRFASVIEEFRNPSTREIRQAYLKFLKTALKKMGITLTTEPKTLQEIVAYTYKDTRGRNVTPFLDEIKDRLRKNKPLDLPQYDAFCPMAILDKYLK